MNNTSFKKHNVMSHVNQKSASVLRDPSLCQCWILDLGFIVTSVSDFTHNIYIKNYYGLNVIIYIEILWYFIKRYDFWIDCDCLWINISVQKRYNFYRNHNLSKS